MGRRVTNISSTHTVHVRLVFRTRVRPVFTFAEFVRAIGGGVLMVAMVDHLAWLSEHLEEGAGMEEITRRLCGPPWAGVCAGLAYGGWNYSAAREINKGRT